MTSTIIQTPERSIAEVSKVYDYQECCCHIQQRIADDEGA